MTSAPEVKKKQALSLWIVPNGNGKVRRLRLGYLTLFLITILAGAGIVGVAWLAGDYARVNWHRLKNYLAMRQLEAERDALLHRERELEQQVQSLSTLRLDSLAYEQDVRQKLSELSNVLERATSLEIVEQDENADQNAPLEGLQSGTERDGMGGAEIDCFTNGWPSLKCGSSAAFLRQVSLLNVGFKDWNEFISPTNSDSARAQVDPAALEQQGSGQGLIELIDQYVRFLEGIPLHRPAQGGKISSGYGFRYSPFTRHLSLHEGIDVSLSHGTNIYATANGTITRLERNATYGLMVDVEHSDKVVTRYAHLSKALVSEGQTVTAGQLLGLAGSTGRSTGPHLHYEVRVDGRAKNPKNFLSLSEQLKDVL